MATHTEELQGLASSHWKSNHAVCVFGCFTTIVAMTLLLPFLPLYVQQLGVEDPAAIAQWSGIAFGATFFSAALVAPLWGRLADLYGRKAMLIRASLGMAIAMALIGVAHNVWELVGYRLLAGVLGGYASGSNILVATQTPKGWALGVLASGIMAGNLVGPLVGGVLPPLIGIRQTFFAAGALIFVAFIATTVLIKEGPRAVQPPRKKKSGTWSAIPDKTALTAMLVTGLLLMFANMSIEPIITLYVAQLVSEASTVTVVSGVVMSAAALGSVLSAPLLGRLADRIGHWNIVILCLLVSALLLIPQAFVTASWQLVALRFLMGLALGGLLPCVATLIRHNVPDAYAGAALGYSVSAQYTGLVLGPITGGFIAGHMGMRPVFLATAVLMAIGSVYAWSAKKRVQLLASHPEAKEIAAH
jgi:MFS family permease